MRLAAGTYVTDNSDLKANILKVHYQTDEYARVRAVLVGKSNKIAYEKKNYKLIKSRIKHWRKV